MESLLFRGVLEGVRTVQVCILDGNKYTSRCREAGEQRLEILDECEVRYSAICWQ